METKFAALIYVAIEFKHVASILLSRLILLICFDITPHTNYHEIINNDL